MERDGTGYPTVPFLHPPHRVCRRITASAVSVRRPTLTGLFISTRSAVAVFAEPRLQPARSEDPVARA